MKTLEQKLQDTKDYLAKSAQHLFVVNDNQITKVITFAREGKEYFGKLIIQGDNVKLSVYPADKMKWDAKDILFPKYVKTKSIPYFKAMREIVGLVESKIQIGDNKALIEEIQTKVKSLELVK